MMKYHFSGGIFSGHPVYEIKIDLYTLHQHKMFFGHLGIAELEERPCGATIPLYIATILGQEKCQYHSILFFCSVRSMTIKSISPFW